MKIFLERNGRREPLPDFKVLVPDTTGIGGSPGVFTATVCGWVHDWLPVLREVFVVSDIRGETAKCEVVNMFRSEARPDGVTSVMGLLYDVTALPKEEPYI